MATPRLLLLSASMFMLAGFVAPAGAKPAVIRDQCNQTSGDGQGHDCAGANDLLIRPQYSDGSCGDWICCPPNPDGQTYDCTKATNPTRGAVKDILQGLKNHHPDLRLDEVKPQPEPNPNDTRPPRANSGMTPSRSP